MLPNKEQLKRITCYDTVFRTGHIRRLDISNVIFVTSRSFTKLEIKKMEMFPWPDGPESIPILLWIFASYQKKNGRRHNLAIASSYEKMDNSFGWGGIPHLSLPNYYKLVLGFSHIVLFGSAVKWLLLWNIPEISKGKINSKQKKNVNEFMMLAYFSFQNQHFNLIDLLQPSVLIEHLIYARSITIWTYNTSNSIEIRWKHTIISRIESFECKSYS